MSHDSLTFTVRRGQPELVAPSKPTPHEFKQLSDIDDQPCARLQLPLVLLYRHDPSMIGTCPLKVIREALAETLVFYYPFAGRLREGPNRKLSVECTGEGVMFIEADADVTLHQFGDDFQSSRLPCLMEELLFDVPHSGEVLNSPLLLIQVTRLKCGGFIFALRFNHAMSDGFGIAQFVTAVGEMARGARLPSILPVWERHLLNARDPPRITCIHRTFDPVANANAVRYENLTHHSFFFGPSELLSLRETVSSSFGHCSSFELLTAYMWRLRTKALKLGPGEEVRVNFPVTARSKFNPPLVPLGYYGNAFAMVVAITTAGDLCQNPIEYALELVRRAKTDMTEEYMKSSADLMVISSRASVPDFSTANSYFVTDNTRIGFRNTDFGWGKACYGGLPTARDSFVAELPPPTFYTAFRNSEGEDGTVISLWLPAPAMQIFMMELYVLLCDGKPN